MEEALNLWINLKENDRSCLNHQWASPSPRTWLCHPVGGHEPWKPQYCKQLPKHLDPPASGPAPRWDSSGLVTSYARNWSWPPVAGSLWIRQGLATNWAGGQPCLPVYPQQSTRYNKRPTQPTRSTALEHITLMTTEECVAGPHRTSPT